MGFFPVKSISRILGKWKKAHYDFGDPVESAYVYFRLD